ncbi:sensor histidine kinase [Aestuariispira ectoiniformans]|uniref:sensor histidine kinase n=1 Tax=Aestuariispira ectoiniformans TaxID=2775080 RepID=UPI00223AC88F|nr:sensor histidine kinase [Aestuariispira ectoiniformans]
MDTPDQSPQTGKTAPQAPKRHRRLLSPLTRKILAVNFVALAIPVAGMLYLGPYRDQLIAQEMEALRTHGEIFSGALGEGAISILDNGQEVLSLVPARHIVRRLSNPSRVRARLFLGDGSLAADSRRLGGFGNEVTIESLPEISEESKLLSTILDMMAGVTAMMEDHAHPVYQDRNGQTAADFPEVTRALRGDIAGVVRQRRNGKLILSVALPVQRYYQVIGALLLSKEGNEIEAAMREVRLNILFVFAGALVITTLMSLYLAGTIARPVHKLAEAAERVRHTVGKTDEQIPDFSARKDEIGDLSGALREMTNALRARLTAIESFAADVSHEIKNPLTSLRSAVETVARVKDEKQREKLLRIIQDDVLRLDRLITDISDASRLDAELSRADTAEVSVVDLIGALIDMHNATAEDRGIPSIHLDCLGDGPFLVNGIGDRLVQVFRNLVGNAVTFSPKDGRITIRVWREGNIINAVVEDDGPGIPDNKLEAIFDRFYTERPEAEKFGTHSGLGLAISKQIIEAHNGTIRAENRRHANGDPKGARFVVKLPAA